MNTNNKEFKGISYYKLNDSILFNVNNLISICDKVGIIIETVDSDNIMTMGISFIKDDKTTTILTKDVFKSTPVIKNTDVLMHYIMDRILIRYTKNNDDCCNFINEVYAHEGLNIPIRNH